MEKQKESLERAKAEKPYPKERKQKKRNRKQRGERISRTRIRMLHQRLQERH